MLHCVYGPLLSLLHATSTGLPVFTTGTVSYLNDICRAAISLANLEFRRNLLPYLNAKNGMTANKVARPATKLPAP